MSTGSSLTSCRSGAGRRLLRRGVGIALAREARGVRRAAALAAPERVRVGLLAGLVDLLLLRGQGRSDVLEVALGGLDPQRGLHDAAEDHHDRADEIADEDLARLPALDQGTEQQRATEAADDRAGSVEEGDRHRAR